MPGTDWLPNIPTWSEGGPPEGDSPGCDPRGLAGAAEPATTEDGLLGGHHSIVG
jgi:hypothetical protein